MDLHSDPSFQALDVAIVSIAFDTQEQQLNVIEEFNIPDDVPMLIDADANVSTQYDVLQWAVGTGEPGHTFVLVDEEGNIAWIRDYGSPSLPNPSMYVESDELVQFISENLESQS